MKMQADLKCKNSANICRLCEVVPSIFVQQKYFVVVVVVDAVTELLRV